MKTTTIKFAKGVLATAGAFTLATAASAATVTFTGGVGSPPIPAGQQLYADFNSAGSVGNQSDITGTVGVYNGTIPGTAAEPNFGDQGDDYFAVLGGGGVTFSFAGPGAGIFSFDLGSADTYNQVELFFVSGPSMIFAGGALNPPFSATGDQSIPATNGRVTFTSFGNRITGARFSSTANSFEVDNFAIGAIPEPSTWAMLILGFGLVGGALRRKSRIAFASRAALA